MSHYSTTSDWRMRVRASAEVVGVVKLHTWAQRAEKLLILRLQRSFAASRIARDLNFVVRKV